jgi:ABC-type bacteriocin/lantibiotic exporter with double-glycine peptidase domain
MTARCSAIPASRPTRAGSASGDNAAEVEPVNQVQLNAVHDELPNGPQVGETQWLLKALRPFIRVHIGSLICVLIASLLSLCDPLIIKWLIDVVLPSRQVRLLAAAAAGLLASYIGRIGFQSLGSMLIFGTVQKMIFNLRVDLLDHLHRLSASYHDNRPVRETLFRLEQDVDKIGELGGDLIPEALRTALVGGLLLVIMLGLNWRLTCVAAPALPIFLLFRRYYGRRLKDPADSAQQQSSRSPAFFKNTSRQFPRSSCSAGSVKRPRGLQGRPRTLSRRKLSAERTRYVLDCGHCSSSTAVYAWCWAMAGTR